MDIAQLPSRTTAIAYADLFDVWSRIRHREVAAGHQLGYLEGPRPRPWRRRRPPMPLLRLVVDRLVPMDARSLTRAPAADLVLTVWGPGTISVRRGDDWIYVVDSDRPLHPDWLRLLASSPKGPRGSGYAVVTLAGTGPTPAGRFRLADVDPTHASLVHVDAGAVQGVRWPRP